MLLAVVLAVVCTLNKAQVHTKFTLLLALILFQWRSIWRLHHSLQVDLGKEGGLSYVAHTLDLTY